MLMRDCERVCNYLTRNVIHIIITMIYVHLCKLFCIPRWSISGAGWNLEVSNYSHGDCSFINLALLTDRDAYSRLQTALLCNLDSYLNLKSRTNNGEPTQNSSRNMKKGCCGAKQVKKRYVKTTVNTFQNAWCGLSKQNPHAFVLKLFQLTLMEQRIVHQAEQVQLDHTIPPHKASILGI